MSLLEAFGVDMDQIKEGGGRPTFEDGSYEYTISEVRIQNGTQKNPDVTYLVISYNLDESGTFQEWFQVANDGELDARSLQSLGFLKSRLIELGLKGDALTNVSDDDLVGIRGTFRLVTTKNAKGEFQNIKHLTVMDGDVSEDPTDYDDDSAAADIAAKKRVAAKQAARKKAEAAKKAAAVVEDEDEDDNPYED